MNIEKPLYLLLLRACFNTQQLYDKAIKVILQTEFNDFLMSLSARILLTKIYIETKDFDVAENHIATFKKYIRRQKNIGYHKDRVLKFLLMCEQLIIVKSASKKQQKLFQLQLSNDNALMEKEWLLEQI
jgi:large-conductance mechanosensitive channel